MKIGILTFHRAYNFGAFLQAFALKSFLEQRGHQVEFVDYWPKEHAVTNRAFRLDAVHSLSGLLRECLLFRNRRRRYRQFRQAQMTCLGIDRRIRYPHSEDLQSVSCDCLVYGSDQIWWKGRLADTQGFDAVYWGDNVGRDIRKVAYAASMGFIHLDEADNAFIHDHLKQFNALSVREKALADVLAPLSPIPVHQVLDPTLLMPPSFWEQRCHDIPDTDYILYYKVMGNAQCDHAVDELHRQTGLKVITLLGSIYTYHTLDSYSRQGNPFTFVSLIRHARFVVSTSFHGVAFSIIFKKPFVATGMGENAGRVRSLLQLLGLEHCYAEHPEQGLTLSAVDYAEADARLQELRAASSHYLLSSIES